MINAKHFTLFLGLSFAVVMSEVRAEGWGDLTAKFIYSGERPQAKQIPDAQAVCSVGVEDETLIVDPTTGAVVNVIVSLDNSDPANPMKSRPIPIHPDYERKVKDNKRDKECVDAEVVLDNRACRFEPRIVALRPSQTLVVTNSDNFGHNVNIQLIGRNVIVPSKGEARFDMKAAAFTRVPSNVSCNIHMWMTALLVVKDHPYVGISGTDGRVTIPKLPAGKWTFHVWHTKHISNPKLNNTSVEWKKGRVEFLIKDGQVNDLGTVEFAL